MSEPQKDDQTSVSPDGTGCCRIKKYVPLCLMTTAECEPLFVRNKTVSDVIVAVKRPNLVRV